MSRFNDDDVYVYRADTLQVVRVVPCSDSGECRRVLANPGEGLLAVRGMRAKALQLRWL